MNTKTIRTALRRFLPRGVARVFSRLYYPRKIRRMSPSEWPPARFVQALLSPGDSAVDVGANIGYVTYWLSRWVGAEGRVHSFEPVPQTFALLAHNVEKLGLKNVRLYRAAVTDREGTVRLEVPQWAGGGENLYEARILECAETPRGQVVTAPAISLDRVFANSRETPGLLKIDVEGHEDRALRGAREVLEKARPALIVEVSEAGAANVFASLSALGYACFVPDGAACRAQREVCALPDAFFLQPGHLARLRERGVWVRD